MSSKNTQFVLCSVDKHLRESAESNGGEGEGTQISAEVIEMMMKIARL